MNEFYGKCFILTNAWNKQQVLQQSVVCLPFVYNLLFGSFEYLQEFRFLSSEHVILIQAYNHLVPKKNHSVKMVGSVG